MAKRLIKYEDHLMRFFGDGEWEQKVDLFIEETYLFGLLKRIRKTVYTITMFDNLKNHYDHWDKLIKNKTKL